MHRLILLSTLWSVIAVPPLAAQDAEAASPTHIYVAYHNVDVAHLQDWIADHYAHTAPLMDELQDEGLIEGWNVWMHHTGPEYNWMMNIRTTGWPQLGEFWTQFLQRLQERAPEVFARTGEMILAHRDEIWNIQSVTFREGETNNALRYDLFFQVGFDHLERWDAIWDEVLGPVENQAMEDGLLEGVVRFAHNTGGRFNVRVSYFFAEWDRMDDLFGPWEEALLTSPLADEFLGMWNAHEDAIWRTVPPPEGT